MRCSSSLVPTMGGVPSVGSCWTIHDRSWNTVTISRRSRFLGFRLAFLLGLQRGGWNRVLVVMAPAWLIRFDLVKMSLCRQPVKSSPCSVQVQKASVIRYSSQKASCWMPWCRTFPGLEQREGAGLSHPQVLSVLASPFAVLGLAIFAACRHGMQSVRRVDGRVAASTGRGNVLMQTF